MHHRAFGFPDYPRGPRYGPGCVVLVHQRLLTPCAPLASSPRFHRHGLYEVTSLCVNFRRLGDRRVVPCFRWLFFIDMSSSETPGAPQLPLPSSFAANAGLLPFAFATTCRFACPPVGADRVFTQPTRVFTSGLPADWSPSPPPDITTGQLGKFPWQDFHLLERQLASLHRSDPSYIVSVHLRLIGPMRPTGGRIPTSRRCRLYRSALAVLVRLSDPPVVPCFR